MPRRSIAQEFCNAAMISVNGTTAKSSKEIKIGDEIEIRRRNRVTRVAVTNVPESKQVPKASAAALYQVLDEMVIEEDAFS